MNKNFLKYCAVAGIVSMLLYIPIFIISFEVNFAENKSLLLTLLLILSAAAYVFFMAGFRLLGLKMKNSFLVYSSNLLIFFSVLQIFDSALSYYTEEWQSLMIQLVPLIIFMIAYGVVGIFHGKAIMKLEKSLGTLAKKTGIIEIIISAAFLTVILSPIAFLLLIPLYILEAKLLIKASKATF